MTESPEMPETRPGHFADLPYEIQLLILRYVYEPDSKTYLTYLNPSPGIHYHEQGPFGALRESLKPTRLISRLFHDAVTPCIFASIHLHASELSLQRAECIANSSLRQHVREIVHYEGTFAGANPDRWHFLSVLTSHRRRRDYPKDRKFPADGELYDNYLQEIAASGEPDIFTTDRMTALLSKLPKCVTFSTLKYSTEWGDVLTSAYTLRHTGLSYLPKPTLEPTNSNQLSFISSMAQWNPRMLNLTNFSYSSLCTLLYALPDSQSNVGHNWAGKLTYLKLGWPDHTNIFARNPNLVAGFISLVRNLFQNCHELDHLELGSPFQSPPDLSIVPKHSLSKLTCLTLSGSTPETSYEWAEEILYNCIRELSGTLKHLHFRKIGLERYHNVPYMSSRVGSILRLMFNLTPYLNLESCTGLELVSDIKFNVHFILPFEVPGYKPGKSVILQKVQQTVCGQRAWPERFNMDHLPVDLTGLNLHNVEDPAATEEAKFIYSSWHDTVDPWGDETEAETKDVELESDRGLGIFKNSNERWDSKNRRLEDQRAQQTMSNPALVFEEVEASKSKRSRISRVLGFKKGRG